MIYIVLSPFVYWLSWQRYHFQVLLIFHTEIDTKITNNPFKDMNELSPLVIRNYAIFVTYLHNPHNQTEPLYCAKIIVLEFQKDP
jgi:hypothetical protein